MPFLQQLFKASSQSVIGIDLSTETLKAVHVVVAGGRLQMQEAAVRSIAGATDEDIIKALRGAIADLKIHSGRIISIISPHLVITKNIEIPSVNPAEIREIINLQAGRHTPFSREEIVVDFIDIGTYRRSYTKILLVIVARAAVKRQFLLLERAGIPVDKVLLAPEAQGAAAYRLLKLDTSILPGGVIHVDGQFTDFMIVFKDKPIFIRSIPVGAEQLIAERERYQPKLAEEIRRSLEAYQSEDIERMPQSAVLTGAVKDLAFLEGVLSEALRLPVKMVSYLGAVTVAPQAASLLNRSGSTSFMSLLATILEAKTLKVDLTPEEIKLKRAIQQRGRDLLKTGAFVLMAFLLFFFILLGKIHFKNAYLERLNAQHLEILPDAEKLEKEFNRNTLIKGYITGRGYSLEVLTELYNLLPLELELNDIRFDDTGKLTIRGTADSMSAVFAFIDAMEKSPFFKDVKSKYTTKRKEGTRDVTDFEIGCGLEEKAREARGAGR